MRRMRATKALRDLVRETELSPRHLIQPLFVVAEEDARQPIESMPGVERLSIDAPSLSVDTTEGYRPSLDEIVAFVGD